MKMTPGDTSFHSYSECQLKRENITMIVSHLMRVLKISDGHELIPTFGIGHERDNREALSNWVALHEHEINLEETEKRLRILADTTDLKVGH